MLRLNLFLLVLAVVCALSVVTSQHKARRLFQALESEQERADQLDIEFDQLQIELSTWATSPRIEKIAREKLKGTVNVTRFKGLGEMNPQQLRESTMHVDTRRLVQLTVDDDTQTHALMDMLLAKKRAGDRKAWLELKGDLATLEV